MESIPPIVDFDTPVNTLVPLIRFSKCISGFKKFQSRWNYYSIRYTKDDGIIVTKNF